MCKFHKDIARKVATDPTTGRVHPGHEIIIRTALSRYWLERYVAGGESVSGYSPYPMATPQQQESFAASGLKKPMSDVIRNEEEGIVFLRKKLDILGHHQDLSAKGLALPLATARDAFADMAIGAFYQGDPKGDFRFAETISNPALLPLHKAVAFLQADPQTRDVLESLVKGKICTLYTEAPHQVNQALISAYNSLPQGLKAGFSKVASYGGNIALGGFSGLVGHGVHYGSVLGAGVASGMASSVNFGLSALFLGVCYGAWDRAFGGRFRSTRERATAFGVQAALTVAVAFAGQALLGNHAAHDSRIPAQHELTQYQKDKIAYLLKTAPAEQRKSWQDAATAQGLSLQDFMTLNCTSILSAPAPKRP